MASEFSFNQDAVPGQEEPRDYTKIIWIGIVVLLAIAGGFIFAVSNKHDPNVPVARARHILISFSKNDPIQRAEAYETVTRLRQRIINGDSFEKIAREYSDDPTSGPRGGDLGIARKGAYEPAFEEFVWNAPVGQLSDIVQTDYGYHLIIVDYRYIPETVKYDERIDKEADEILRGQDQGQEPVKDTGEEPEKDGGEGDDEPVPSGDVSPINQTDQGTSADMETTDQS